jgi:hypothetical protein
MFSAWWRKLFLTVHVISSVGFLGAVAGFLALAIVGINTTDHLTTAAAYIGMRIVTWDVIVPLTATTLAIGIVQSLGTPWGLFRYYWVIIKLALTLIAGLVLMLRTPTIDALSAAALRGADLSAVMSDRIAMVLHGAGGLAVLVVVTVLSVYKPRGLTRYGAAALEVGA